MHSAVTDTLLMIEVAAKENCNEIFAVVFTVREELLVSLCKRERHEGSDVWESIATTHKDISDVFVAVIVAVDELHDSVDKLSHQTHGCVTRNEVLIASVSLV